MTMRMIDADALWDNLQALAYDDWNQGVTTSWADAYRKIADMVEEMPTIERKKGKWIVYYHGEADFSYSCNQCGYSAPYGQYGGEYSQKKWRFCPNCGAEMDF